MRCIHCRQFGKWHTYWFCFLASRKIFENTLYPFANSSSDLLTTNTNSIEAKIYLLPVQRGRWQRSRRRSGRDEFPSKVKPNRGIFHFWNEKLIFVSSALTKCFGFYFAFGLSVRTKKPECRQSWPTKNNKRQQMPIIGCFNGFNFNVLLAASECHLNDAQYGRHCVYVTLHGWKLRGAQYSDTMSWTMHFEKEKRNTSKTYQCLFN